MTRSAAERRAFFEGMSLMVEDMEERLRRHQTLEEALEEVRRYPWAFSLDAYDRRRQWPGKKPENSPNSGGQGASSPI